MMKAVIAPMSSTSNASEPLSNTQNNKSSAKTTIKLTELVISSRFSDDLQPTAAGKGWFLSKFGFFLELGLFGHSNAQM